MNEEDRAIALLLLQRGLTTPEALRRTADVVLGRRAAGQRAEVLPVLVELGALSREAAADVWRVHRGGAPTDLTLPVASPAPVVGRPVLPPPPPLPALPPLPSPPPPQLEPDSGEFDPTGVFEALAAPPAGDVLGFGPPVAPPAPFVPPPASEAPTALGLPAVASSPSPPPRAPAPREASPEGSSTAPAEAALAPRPVSGRAARRGASGRLAAHRTPAVLPLAGAAVVAVIGFVAVAVWVVRGRTGSAPSASHDVAPASEPEPAARPAEPATTPPPLAQVEPEKEADRVAEDLLSRASDLVWERERYEEAVTLLEGFPPRLRGAPVYAEVTAKLAEYRRYAELRGELEEALAGGAGSKALRRWIARIEGGHLAEDAYALPCVERFRERARALLGGPAYDALAVEAADLDEAAGRRSPGLGD